MYNGKDLKTARRSGTNGCVKKSKFCRRRGGAARRSSSAGRPPKPPVPGDGEMGKPNKEILEHDRKRKEELLLLLMRDTLEEHGYTEGEIEERVEERRRNATAGAASCHPRIKFFVKPPVSGNRRCPAASIDDAGGGMRKPRRRSGSWSTTGSARQVELRLLLLRGTIETRKEAEMEWRLQPARGGGRSRREQTAACMPLSGKAENSSYFCFCQQEVL
ncbi:hypothetical protein GUJ93_ZPchr0004g38733 [Zizania palustris]|uniref:CWF21 domain-containing protein n=1 Tax=Zizania palustris TaxID=103762 RepID=A0A8J5VZI2_ZIZPA|nr:hypothetical protein GUJ93_ZPchr0004g38733 [Zizania palustris]